MTDTRWVNGGIEYKARRWSAADHPRDSKGRFIETGAEVRIFGGARGTVLRNVGGGKIEVQRSSDGAKLIVHRNFLEVVKGAGGKAPTAQRSDAVQAAPVQAPSPDAVEATPGPPPPDSTRPSAAVQEPTTPEDRAARVKRMQQEALQKAGLDDGRWKVTGNYVATSVTRLQPGDVIRTQGDGVRTDPVELPRRGGGKLSRYADKHREVARVDKNDDGTHTVHFTDGTSTGAEGGSVTGSPYKGAYAVYAGDRSKVVGRVPDEGVPDDPNPAPTAKLTMTAYSQSGAPLASRSVPSSPRWRRPRSSRPASPSPLASAPPPAARRTVPARRTVWRSSGPS